MSTQPDDLSKRIGLTFQEHLDRCRQCREHPLELCPLGAWLLQKAVADV
jgi:transposase